MILGNKDIVAIECYHEPFGVNKNVFGRMCFWLNGKTFGDLSEPSCMLDVTEKFLNDFIDEYKQLEDPDFINYSDFDLFNFLDSKLYTVDYSDGDQVVKDAKKYFKFDFLTGGGESFDKYKSFIIKQNKIFRILYTDDKNNFFSVHIPVDDLINIVNSFLNWVKKEKESFPAQDR